VKFVDGTHVAVRAVVRTRRPIRGVTLVEVLVVVALIALVAAGVAFAVVPRWVDGQKRVAATGARTIRSAVKSWWVDHDPATCPDVDQLIGDGILDRDSPRTDPWGTPWRVECASHDATIVSAGPDRKPDTPDDIRIPPA